jgi:hypothetical protein
MSVHDEIECIGNTAKNEIILAWFDYLDLKISEKSMVQKFHVETGHVESIDSIEWYVRQWRGY